MMKILVYDDDLTTIDVIKKDKKTDLFSKDLEKYANYIVLDKNLEEQLIKAVENMYIMESKEWCCERCGALIKGKCKNVDGFVTHINNCSEVKR